MSPPEKFFFAVVLDKCEYVLRVLRALVIGFAVYLFVPRFSS
jgi:hypothetical protein